MCAARVSDGDHLPRLPPDGCARAPPRARCAQHRHAEHRGRPRGGAGVAPGAGERRRHCRRRTGHPRRSCPPRRDHRGPARGSPSPRPWRGRRPRRGDRPRDLAGRAMKHYRRLLAYLRPYVWPHGAVAVACMLAFSATESAIPFLAKFTFDQVFTQHHSGALPFAVAFVLLAAVPIRYFSAQLRQTSRRQQEAIGRLNALLHENAQGNRVVKAFGQERYEEQRFNEHNERLFHIVLRASVIRSLPITEVLAGIAVAGIIWLAGSSVINGTRTQGAFVGFVITLFLLYEPFK